MKQAHNDLEHKGMFTVKARLSERFWWPDMEEDIKWFVRTCHECQTRLVKKIVIPPLVPTPAGLFQRVYIDTMLMPKAKGYQYIIHACCSLSSGSFPEWATLRNENFKAIAKFIFEVLLCRWGAMELIVFDNAPQYIQAIEYLAEKYNICHIRISLYNLRAQGPIERKHYDVRESLIKAAEGDESKWPEVAPSVFWAERVSIQKSTGYSPFSVMHGVEPLLPFNLAKAIYLSPKIDHEMSTEDLIAQRAIMLQKRPQNLDHVRKMVLKARWNSVKQLEKSMKSRIQDFDFKPGPTGQPGISAKLKD